MSSLSGKKELLIMPSTYSFASMHICIRVCIASSGSPHNRPCMTLVITIGSGDTQYEVWEWQLDATLHKLKWYSPTSIIRTSIPSIIRTSNQAKVQVNVQILGTMHKCKWRWWWVSSFYTPFSGTWTKPNRYNMLVCMMPFVSVKSIRNNQQYNPAHNQLINIWNGNSHPVTCER